MTYYLFTDPKAKKIIEVRSFGSDAPGQQAQKYRMKLAKARKEPVVAWCMLGGDNPLPTI